MLTHKGTLGETALVPSEIPFPYLMLTPQVTYYRCDRRKIIPEYLRFFFSSDCFKHQFEIIASHQSTRGYVGLLAQKEIRLLIPPINEQGRILAQVHRQDSVIGQVIQTIQTQLIKLHEYRQALITAAVTGQVIIPEEAT